MLKGKWCLVTGGGRGIGEAIALAFAKEKANLLLVARSSEALRSAAAKCLMAGAGAAEIHSLDLTDNAAVDVVAADVLDSHGRVDVLVNCAGVANPEFQSAITGDPDGYTKTVAINLTAPMRLTRLFSPKMVENNWGVIINISSIYGTVPSTIFGAYAAAKHGLNGWSHSCSKELRPHGVKVVCIQPGPTATEMMRKAAENPAVAAGFDVMSIAMEPEDVAEACMLAIRTSPKCFPEDIILYSAMPGHG